MRRMWVASAAAVLCLSLGVGMTDVAAATPLGFNISTNSGAEAGRGGIGGVVPIPMWKTTSTMTAVRYGAPGFPSKAVAKASHGESNFFYCGRDTAKSVARQRIAISGRNRLIDQNRLSLALTVRIGSNTTDGDTGQMIVRFLDGGGRAVGKYLTQPVSATGGLMPRIKASTAVPARTRALEVMLKGRGTPGTSCDVFFDNVSVKLVR